MKTREQVIESLHTLRPWIADGQLRFIKELMRGEEGEFFREKVCELAQIIQTMPKTYEQDGKGGDAVVYLHYFKGCGDWWIMEKDMDASSGKAFSFNPQAFGYVDLGYGAEMGYINMDEVIKCGVEIDLHWTPRKVREIKKLGGLSDDPEMAASTEKVDVDF